MPESIENRRPRPIQLPRSPQPRDLQPSEHFDLEFAAFVREGYGDQQLPQHITAAGALLAFEMSNPNFESQGAV